VVRHGLIGTKTEVNISRNLTPKYCSAKNNIVVVAVVKTPAHNGNPNNIFSANAVPIISGISEAIIAD
jgi:hypothetical protein